jgi:hypothetical protein
MTLVPQSLEYRAAIQLDLSRPSLCIPEPAVHPVAASASHTTVTPLLALDTTDAVGAAHAPVCLSELQLRIANALITGFVVDDENPLPWLEELAGFTLRQEHALPLTGPRAGAWVHTAYEDDQMDISFSERSSFNSEVDQPETPAEAEVNDAITSVLAPATDLNEEVAAVGGAALDEPTDTPMKMRRGQSQLAILGQHLEVATF